MKWITYAQAVALHDRQLELHGGGGGMRDQGLLISALECPKNKHHYGENDIHALAAAYAFGLAKNHPFIDGNKRTAMVVSFTFLQRNGFSFTATNDEAYDIIIQLAEGTLEEEVLTAWFRAHSFVLS